MAWLAAWVIAAPCAAGAICFALAGRARSVAGVAGAAATAGLSLALAAVVGAGGARDLYLGGWAPPLGIRLRADGLSAFFIAVQGAVGALVGAYAASYFFGRGRAPWFWPLFLLLWAALGGLYLTGDLFNAYVALELVGVAAVGLVAMEGGPALVAAIRYMLVTLLGSLLYLAGVALVYAETGVVDMEAAAPALAGTPAAQAALPLMAAGLLLKTAAFPLHFWLPPAHANAAAPASAVLSGLVIKGSLYLLVRLWTAVFPADASAALAEALGALGVAAVVWGSAQALRQARLKMLVAYSTVAQVGYLLMPFPLGGDAWRGALYFAAAHATAKAAMFLAAGTIARELGHDDISRLRGAAVALPAALFSFALAGVALVGLPPTGGFVGKWLIFSEAFQGGRPVYAAAIPAGTLLAAGYVFRVVGPALEEVPGAAPRPARWTLEAPTLALAVVAVAMGFSLAPALALLEAGRPLEGAP